MDEAWILPEIFAEVTVKAVDYYWEELTTHIEDKDSHCRQLYERYMTVRHLFQVNKSMRRELLSGANARSPLFVAFFSARVHLSFLLAMAARLSHAMRCLFPSTLQSQEELVYLRALGWPSQVAIASGRIAIHASERLGFPLLKEIWTRVQKAIFSTFLHSSPARLSDHHLAWTSFFSKEAMFRENKGFHPSMACPVTPYTTPFMSEVEKRLTEQASVKKGLLCFVFDPLKETLCDDPDVCSETECMVAKTLTEASNVRDLFLVCLFYPNPV